MVTLREAREFLKDDYTDEEVGEVLTALDKLSKILVDKYLEEKTGGNK